MSPLSGCGHSQLVEGLSQLVALLFRGGAWTKNCSCFLVLRCQGLADDMLSIDS